jgi:putative ABC transport system permease protein
VEPGAGVRTADALGATWATLNPDTPFEPFFQDSVFDESFRGSRGITNIFAFTAILALLISCLGLFGLAAQNTASRMKEMTIRKILGATVGHMAGLANRRFLVLLALAALVATPLSYALIKALLDSIYRYHIGVGPASFVTAYLLVFAIAVLTVSSQIRKLAGVNPAEVLRND